MTTRVVDSSNYSGHMSFSNPRPVAISIDFGTSNTVATIRRADGRVTQLLFDGAPQLPSAVFLNDDGGLAIGTDAVHSGRRRPDRFEPNPKRHVDDESILLGDTEIPTVSVIAAVLSRAARECERTLGSLGPVTITVPAAWGPLRRHVVADAATAAGLGTVDLVPEPVAAASYFVETLGADVPPGSGVVVYDLGGGTFDATVLRSNANGFDVLAVDGATDLGGLDFDHALAKHLAATVQPGDDRWNRLLHPAEAADQRSRTGFMEEVRLAKERLSRSASTDLTIPILDIDAHLTRDEIEQVCAPLVARTVRVVQSVIRESGLAANQITGLFLVGAASRMPLVATRLHRELGIAPAVIEQPEFAVSEGGLTTRHTISTPGSIPGPALPPLTEQVERATPVAPRRGLRRRLIVLAAVAGILGLVAGGLLAFQHLPLDRGALNAGDGGGSSESAVGEDTEKETEDPIATAAAGDQITEMSGSHLGPVLHVRTGQIDGEPVAITAGEDKAIRIWDVTTGLERARFSGHEGPIEHLSVIELDGRSVAFSRDASTEIVWYLDDPENPIASRAPDYGWVFWVGVLDEEPVYFTESELRNLYTGEPVRDMNFAFSETSVLTHIDGELRQAGTYENSVFVADFATGALVGDPFEPYTGDLAAFTAGGAGERSLAVTVGTDGTVQAWDLATAERYGTAGSEPEQAVNSAQVFNLYGKDVVLLQGDRGLSVFDLQAGARAGEIIAPHTGDEAIRSTAVAWIDDKALAVIGTGSGEVEVWRL
jgi:actin-like ATPase involved in cell morphogenesis